MFNWKLDHCCITSASISEVLVFVANNCHSRRAFECANKSSSLLKVRSIPDICLLEPCCAYVDVCVCTPVLESILAGFVDCECVESIVAFALTFAVVADRIILSV